MGTFRLLRRNVTSNVILFIIIGISVTLIFNWLFASRVKESLVFDEDEDDIHAPSYDFAGYAEYATALRETASDDKTVVLGLVDSSYIEMAYNFYYASIIKHNIHNFLFVALDYMACERLHAVFPERRVRCFVYKELPTAIHASLYESDEFREKIYLRRFLILQGLRLGYNMLLTDLDMVYLQNPIKDVKQTCTKRKCDIAAEWDNHLEKYNAGFIYVRATDASVKFYQRLARYEISHGVGQMALNAAIREHKGRKNAPVIVPLSPKKHLTGITLFPRNNCPDAKEYKDALVIHNNYILEQQNKIFRLKQCMLWDFEGSNGYYSNPTRRYITIRNAGNPGYEEHQSMVNVFAIAKLLGRTVILPRFACKKPSKCHLLQRIYDHSHLHFLKRFHNSTNGDYRESSFLHNPRVPDAIKTSVSPFYHISFREESKEQEKGASNLITLTPRDPQTGPTSKEIVQWFGQNKDKVLHFDNLIGHYKNIDHIDLVGENFVKIIRQL